MTSASFSRSAEILNEASDFVSSVAECLISLVPVVPLFTSAASLHWFLRQLAHYCPAHLLSQAIPACMEVLNRLAVLKEENASDLSNLLQTQLVVIP